MSKSYILYKAPMDRDGAMLKPNTKYWRCRFRVVQFVSLLCRLIIIPVVWLEYRCYRVPEGEFISGVDFHRLGIIVTDEEKGTFVKIPFFLRHNRRTHLYWARHPAIAEAVEDKQT